MSFTKGAVAGRRYRISAPVAADEASVDRIRLYSFETPVVVDEKSGVSCGWTSGEDHLAADFSPEKLLRGEFLAFGFRVTRTQIPPAELKARTRVELDALVKAGKKVNAATKREAKEAAMGFLEERARDGRFTKHSHVPVVIDTTSKQVWFGHTSRANLHLFEELFVKTFGVYLTMIRPAELAELPDYPGDAPKWVADEVVLNAWGTRWAELVVKESIAGVKEFDADGQRVAVMVHQSLSMGSPQADKGACVFRDDLPDRMPEAVRAVQEGKLPTGLGLEAGWPGYDGTVKFSLVPHDWVVSGAKVPEPDHKDRAVREAERLLNCREFFAVLDGLFVSYARNVAKAASGDL